MEYYRLRQLGKGSFSKVYMIKNTQNGKIFVQKIIKEKYFDYSEQEAKILRLLKKIRHENIVEFIDEIIVDNTRTFIFEKLHMNLFNYYKQYNEHITFKCILSFSKQIASALDFLHSLFLIHADIKPENIMISDTYEQKFKIIDMGSCIINDNNKKTNFYVVSRYYRAPELVYHNQFNEKIDIWALGCVIYEMFTYTPLFYAKNTFYLREILYTFDFNTNLMNKLKYSKNYYNNTLLIKTCIVDFLIFLLECDHQKRFSAKQCLDHKLLLMT